LDSKGRRLSKSAIQTWKREALRELHECFGAATASPAPGTNVVDGRLLYEKGQILVWSLCKKRAEYVRKRERLRAFGERMGSALDQDRVLVVGVASDSFIIMTSQRGDS